MTLQDWTALGQLILTPITGIGVIVSMVVSVRALREVQEDRRQRQMPHLAFESGGHRVPVKFVKAGTAIPGVDPGYAKRVIGELPRDAESVRIRDRRGDDGSLVLIDVGCLRNYGVGPALETDVTWVAERVVIGSEVFRLDSSKLSEPRYSRALNSMPADASHILPGEKSCLTRLPTFIEKDTDRKVSEVEGCLEIECLDVLGATHVVRQDFYIATGYSDEHPYVHVTFGDIRNDGGESA